MVRLLGYFYAILLEQVPKPIIFCSPISVEFLKCQIPNLEFECWNDYIWMHNKIASSPPPPGLTRMREHAIAIWKQRSESVFSQLIWCCWPDCEIFLMGRWTFSNIITISTCNSMISWVLLIKYSTFLVIFLLLLFGHFSPLAHHYFKTSEAEDNTRLPEGTWRGSGRRRGRVFLSFALGPRCIKLLFSE